jgi:hypothetical protein
MELHPILSYRLHKMEIAGKVVGVMGYRDMCEIEKWVWEDWASRNVVVEMRGIYLGLG